MTPEGRDTSGQAPSNISISRARDYFTVPAPIKRIFDQFPLVTYPPNDLPQRSSSSRSGNRLFVFTDAAGARHEKPSFNPQCLKWQVCEDRGAPLPVLPPLTKS
jgi:metaxin